MRYNVLFDSHSSTLPYIKRFHARRVLRLQDALLTSYHRNEVRWFFICIFQNIEWLTLEIIYFFYLRMLNLQIIGKVQVPVTLCIPLWCDISFNFRSSSQSLPWTLTECCNAWNGNQADPSMKSLKWKQVIMVLLVIIVVPLD